ncbi:MAG: UDP-2,3-diacylglucosamine diphosphatase LpxI [Caulobacteraceae bacterium]|nr:UDP-2,3-diacylglucosamine diphosphatase LpxI [Caulobacteraceae bacterium]
MRKLGLIAGAGALPVSLASHCRSAGRPLFVVRLKGFAPAELAGFDGADVGLAELGKGLDELEKAGCEAVCFAGGVARPHLPSLVPDLRGLAALPGAIVAARRGDDALLSFLVREFEKEGFAVEGAHEVMAELVLPVGILGRHGPGAEHALDIARGLDVARAMGALDVGQGAVCCDGLILAIEAQEGTDAMLRRVADLPGAIRGAAGDRRGVFVKASKPGQEMRVDLPTIGSTTMRHAADAGLAGVVGEAGRVLVVDRPAVIRLADELGLFVLGAA